MAGHRLLTSTPSKMKLPLEPRREPDNRPVGVEPRRIGAVENGRSLTAFATAPALSSARSQWQGILCEQHRLSHYANEGKTYLNHHLCIHMAGMTPAYWYKNGRKHQTFLKPGGTHLVGSAVEEILRYASPIYHDLRVAARDTMLGGQKIERGDLVTKWLASANRDEEVFENPDTFGITRNPNPHLAFGYGQHFCLGANLARVEMRTTLEELIPYLRQIELADEPQRTGNSSIQGYWRMPIRFRNVNRSIHV